MSVIEKLASSLGRRDEVPNQELAKQIASKNDKKGVEELVENLQNKDKAIQADCIKTLYEVGEIKPTLIASHAKNFIALLDSKNNRLQWGAMTALSNVALENPKPVYAALGKILEAAHKGTVITKDHCAAILIKLGSVKQYAEDSFLLLMELLQVAPPNQFPTYAENAMPLVNDKNKAIFLKILHSRLDDIETETKKKRVEKVIKKLKN